MGSAPGVDPDQAVAVVTDLALMLGVWAGAVIVAVLVVLGIIRLFLGYWP